MTIAKTAATAAAVAAMAGGLVMTGTSQAVAHVGDVCTVPGCNGSASFVRNGEHLYVWDNKADGRSVVAEYERSDADQLGRAWNARGAGSSPTDHNMSMPERETITYRVCLGNYSTNAPDRVVHEGTCSGWYTEPAG
ncbi:hypothetical protein SAMN05216266_12263 [Amycolatopsis marina]|uniref:Peptidase inhibitor family I36 n=1 Tax=Amycolatopsis marina TaxID=490629 RepID=A0A1I1CDX1_9PSEU|nr:hypothetical protein [Amycolatopsis marina]SFB58633.1 hypothetical protein SAMN05216266_12263 [Amycolatopsis marina]